MQAKSIGADALRRFFSGMLDKVAPVVPVEEESLIPAEEAIEEEADEWDGMKTEDEERGPDWRWEGSPGRV